MLNQDYKDILQSLQNHDVEHILVGAYALAAHGYPRSTLDIDIWVNPTESNSLKLFQALSEFGAPLHEINENTFSEKGIVFQIGVAPCRIDFITQISGDIDFEPALARAGTAEMEGLLVRALSVEDLIRNKEAIGRPKDKEDAQRLRNRVKR